MKQQSRYRRAQGAIARGRSASSAGFTLLELLVVMVIIGLLVGYVAPNYFSAVGKSEIKATKAQVDALQKALVAYRLDVGSFPSSETGLAALHAKPAGLASWAGPYLSKPVPKDPWGHAYVYRHPGTRGEYDLYSYGRDGKPGGSGEAADISN
ncbi:general secretion pathway protein G [Janthinobacterium sp. CG_23.3]|uniref:type II secretion system major pseudopilin GspG n=1 Tax=unclassified Janthinobacterium TaxID=2610881 RepID=UPI0006862446|nr:MULTISPECIES: type II secretion system major pseudopilin GspG [unclassified Janthinobacterium]MEC5159558.1 general secretion pathway protein G [Janthinobacterium sp. CG_S6]